MKSNRDTYKITGSLDQILADNSLELYQLPQMKYYPIFDPTFLEKVSNNFDIVVFSNRKDSYVQDLINHIDPQRRYIRRVISDTPETSIHQHLSYPLNRLIVVGNIQSFIPILANVIPMHDFFIGITNDSFDFALRSNKYQLHSLANFLLATFPLDFKGNIQNILILRFQLLQMISNHVHG